MLWALWGLGDSRILAAGLGLWKGVCGGRGVDRFCLTAAGVWIGFINGNRTTISTAAVGFVFMGFGWAAKQQYISFLVVKNEVKNRSNFRVMMSKFRVLKMVL